MKAWPIAYPKYLPPLYTCLVSRIHIPSSAMFRQSAFLALASLSFSLAQVSEDFENGWDETAWPIYAPDCNEGGSVSLDNSVAHSGTNSVKVEGAGGFCGHMFFGTEEVPTGDIFVRTYL